MRAMGVVVPMVNSRAEAEAAVSACRYPPRGTRSVGGTAHALNFGTTADDYYAHADREILVCIQCEHRLAVEHADEIFSVPGIDAVFVGPFDLAASYRGPNGEAPNEATITSAMEKSQPHAKRQSSGRRALLRRAECANADSAGLAVSRFGERSAND